MEARHAGAVACPVCGLVEHPVTVPIRLTAEQAKDLGIDDEHPRGGITIMANEQQETQKSRYPAQEVNEGQKHGYIGEDVEIYDPETGKKVGKGVAPHEATSGVDEAGKSDADAPVGETGTIKANDTADLFPTDRAQPKPKGKG